MNSSAGARDGNEAKPRWSLQLFGGVKLRTLGGNGLSLPGKRERALLAYLATTPNCRESRRKLATLLWGDADDETLLDNLRVCLWGLRKTLNDTEHRIVMSEDDSISLDSRFFEVDVTIFRALAAQSDRAALEAAANLYTGEFLGDLVIESEELQSWARDEGGRFRDLALDILDRLAAQIAQAGDLDRAIEVNQRIVRLDPLHEGAIRRLMRLHSDAGRRGAALQLYRSLAETLKTELNAEPEAETRRLRDEISRGDSSSDSVGRTPVQARAPESVDGAIAAGSSTARTMTASFFAMVRSARGWAVWTGAAGIVLVAAAMMFAIYLSTGGAPQSSTLALPEKPSIAVLPFETLSGESAQDDFAEALTNDVTTALSMVSEMFVIDRASTVRFGETPVPATQAASDLGVRYVLEGSVQRSMDRVRVSVALVDGASGRQLWAERYDREVTDTFALQDEMTLAILTALQVQLTEGEQERVAAVHGTRNLEAWILAGQGSKALRLLTVEDNIRAREFYRRAAALDPDYADAVDGLAWSYLLSARFGWSGMPAADLATAAELGEKALTLDPMRPRAYALVGAIQLLMGDHAQAVSSGEKGIALDPNSSTGAALLALTLTYTDDVARSPDLLARAMRLSPYYPDWYRWALGRSYRLLGRYGEAEAVLAARDGSRPPTLPYLVELAAMQVERGNLAEARATAREILGLAPEFSVLAWTATPSHQNPNVTERERGILYRADLP